MIVMITLKKSVTKPRNQKKKKNCRPEIKSTNANVVYHAQVFIKRIDTCTCVRAYNAYGRKQTVDMF